MKWFILLVGVVVVCAVVAMILGLAGGGLGRPTSSLSHEPLPEDPIADGDFDDLVFDVAARGYRMGQVDGVIDRLRRELREKDEQIAVLRGETAEGVEGAEGAEHAEPAEAIDSVEPIDSAEPEETAQPVESVESAGPDEPVRSTHREPADGEREVDTAAAKDSRTA